MMRIEYFGVRWQAERDTALDSFAVICLPVT